MRRRVRVLIADDQGSIRQGLRALLSLCPEVEVVGEARDGRQALQLVEKHQPDVVLMDMHMPMVDGVEATRSIKDRWPEVKVIGLTMYPKYRVAAAEAGIDAFLLKGSPTLLLHETILAQYPELLDGEGDE